MNYFFNLEITNLLSVVYFTQYVSTIIPPSSMGITKLSKYTQKKNN